MLLSVAVSVEGVVSTVWQPLPPEAFTSVEAATPRHTAMPSATPTPSASAEATATPRATRTPRPTASPSPKRTPTPTIVANRSISGRASWYCSPALPTCHRSYPVGSMVAAACGKLRTAMGPNWRGKTVTVTANGNRVSVKLVDWCGSADKLIDLYAAPFSRLAPLSSGVVRVEIRW